MLVEVDRHLEERGGVQGRGEEAADEEGGGGGGSGVWWWVGGITRGANDDRRAPSSGGRAMDQSRRIHRRVSHLSNATARWEPLRKKTRTKCSDPATSEPIPRRTASCAARCRFRAAASALVTWAVKQAVVCCVDWGE